ncbi:MAG: hypothetical protein AAFQ13_00895 [Pseudomonadota bacterium]
MPNTIAYLALILWPVVTLALFASLRPERALIWAILGGYLLLPVRTAFDFPGVPALDKTSIPNISALIGALLFAKGPVVRPPREWWVIALMVLYVVSPMFTVLTNRDPLFFGSVMLPGLRPYDAFSAGAYKIIDLIPFLLGYNLLKGSGAQNYLLRAFMISALGYSLLMLVEIRLSPQLHTWIYGFFPHSFAQQIRDGGFRPVVFMGHGLLVAIYTSMAIVAAAYFAQRRSQVLGVPAWIWLGYLFGVLILCRSLGALILAIAALGVLYLARRSSVRLFCGVMALVVLAYPVLRGADLIPVQSIADQVAAVNEDRAASFQTRIDNENTLLVRANQRPLVGWGGYGRNRVFDELTGRDLSITDGTWIIIVGTNGWVGYITAFGLLCLPMVAVWRRGARLSPASTAVSLILAVNLLDLLPNSSLTPLTWLMAGALLGHGLQSGANRRVRQFREREESELPTKPFKPHPR